MLPRKIKKTNINAVRMKIMLHLIASSSVDTISNVAAKTKSCDFET